MPNKLPDQDPASADDQSLTIPYSPAASSKGSVHSILAKLADPSGPLRLKRGRSIDSDISSTVELSNSETEAEPTKGALGDGEPLAKRRKEDDKVPQIVKMYRTQSMYHASTSRRTETKAADLPKASQDIDGYSGLDNSVSNVP